MQASVKAPCAQGTAYGAPSLAFEAVAFLESCNPAPEAATFGCQRFGLGRGAPDQGKALQCIHALASRPHAKPTVRKSGRFPANATQSAYQLLIPHSPPAAYV